jgi:hypothetical protein
MKSCGKRLFTRACKVPRPRIGGEERGFETERFGFCRAAFFGAWWRGHFAGGFCEKRCFGVVILW